MKIFYREYYVNSHRDTCTAKIITSIEPCCETMGENFINDKDFQVAMNVSGIYFKDEKLVFCPYCGKKGVRIGKGNYILYDNRIDIVENLDKPKRKVMTNPQSMKANIALMKKHKDEVVEVWKLPIGDK
jgi:hypothetical protein